MVSAETATMAEAKMIFMTEAPPSLSGPRISFSADLSSSDSDGDFICINPDKLVSGKEEKDKSSVKAGDFEFLSNTQTMLTPDELFSEGKLLPFWQVKHSEMLQNVTLKTKVDEDKEDRKEVKEQVINNNKEQENNNNRGSWFLDDDPSPRPPKCTVLWKELLRLKKQRTNTTTNSSTRASSLSPSSSSSSTSSSSSSIGDAVKKEEREKEGKRGNKGLERTRSVTMRIRPMIHVPVCTPSKSSAPLPPLFPLRLQKNRVERRT
ncbi:hypothetical protein EUTSA_v10016073mg [Eutrema salsugineum]|uniref:Uncharacterized protein n=1 Tax=Eutrema salsugineum TaxID=72664 RepID=V4LQ09_EUTSA|nr:uncharacterized protein LOC18018559 [Eutrema salsugineum]ESQ41943.1 hypothetical protein EUTSA_v10016073mg [Eutrema salsugineum]